MATDRSDLPARVQEFVREGFTPHFGALAEGCTQLMAKQQTYQGKTGGHHADDDAQ